MSKASNIVRTLLGEKWEVVSEPIQPRGIGAIPLQEVVEVYVAESVVFFDISGCDLELQCLGSQIGERRRELNWSPDSLAISAGVGTTELSLLEKGVAFDTVHDVACKALEALERMESLRAGKAHLHLVQ